MNKTSHILRSILCALAAFAVFAACEQPESPGSIFAAPPAPPDLRSAAPDMPRVTTGDGSITVNWNLVENADGYEEIPPHG